MVVIQKYKSPRVSSLKMPGAVLHLILPPWEVTRPLNMEEDGGCQRCRLFNFHSCSLSPLRASQELHVNRLPVKLSAHSHFPQIFGHRGSHTLWQALGRHREYREIQRYLMRNTKADRLSIIVITQHDHVRCNAGRTETVVNSALEREVTSWKKQPSSTRRGMHWRGNKELWPWVVP